MKSSATVSSPPLSSSAITSSSPLALLFFRACIDLVISSFEMMSIVIFNKVKSASCSTSMRLVLLRFRVCLSRAAGFDFCISFVLTCDDRGPTINDGHRYVLFTYTKYLLQQLHHTLIRQEYSRLPSASRTSHCLLHPAETCPRQHARHRVTPAPLQAFPRLPSNYTTSHDLPVTYGISQINLKNTDRTLVNNKLINRHFQSSATGDVAGLITPTPQELIRFSPKFPPKANNVRVGDERCTR